MENLVVTLDTAKKLKAAGFPQSMVYNWHVSKQTNMKNRRNHLAIGLPGYMRPTLHPEWYDYRETVAAPTAQEIADQLPKFKGLDGENIYLGIEIDPFELCWVAEYKNEDYETRGLGSHTGMGVNMAEALAALYLKLHETPSSDNGSVKGEV